MPRPTDPDDPPAMTDLTNQALPAAGAEPLGFRDRLLAYGELMLVDHGVFRAIYSNRHKVSDKLWRSSQPAPWQIAQAARRGIRTIVNLRGPHSRYSYRMQQDACRRHGLTLVNFRVHSRETPRLETLYGLRDLFARIEYPALLHCKSGADRAGLASALYLLVHEGRPIDEAMAQLHLRFGHVRGAKTGILDHFLEQYRQANAASPIDFFDWVETGYDPAAVRASFKPSFAPDLLIDRLLRRE